jgi:hypothetical protein
MADGFLLSAKPAQRDSKVTMECGPFRFPFNGPLEGMHSLAVPASPSISVANLLIDLCSLGCLFQRLLQCFQSFLKTAQTVQGNPGFVETQAFIR